MGAYIAYICIYYKYHKSYVCVCVCVCVCVSVCPTDCEERQEVLHYQHQ